MNDKQIEFNVIANDMMGLYGHLFILNITMIIINRFADCGSANLAIDIFSIFALSMLFGVRLINRASGINSIEGRNAVSQRLNKIGYFMLRLCIYFSLFSIAIFAASKYLGGPGVEK